MECEDKTYANALEIVSQRLAHLRMKPDALEREVREAVSTYYQGGNLVENDVPHSKEIKSAFDEIVRPYALYAQRCNTRRVELANMKLKSELSTDEDQEKERLERVADDYLENVHPSCSGEERICLERKFRELTENN
jgi:hypothetical protein